jgi:hypothetical protein
MTRSIDALSRTFPSTASANICSITDMGYPAYVRERARELRITKQLSIDELAERLALPKTTIYYWVRDLPLQRARREAPQNGTKAMQRKYRRLREAAYKQGRAEYDELVLLPTFRDFVVLYIAEGYKRNRNRVAIGNSDERIVAMSTSWLRRFSRNPLRYAVQYHADHDIDRLCAFWGVTLQIDGADIRPQRKSNSGKLGGRNWRCAHGVLTVTVGDTLLRARLQAWMDRVWRDWGLDSSGAGA